MCRVESTKSKSTPPPPKDHQYFAIFPITIHVNSSNRKATANTSVIDSINLALAKTVVRVSERDAICTPMQRDKTA